MNATRSDLTPLTVEKIGGVLEQKVRVPRSVALPQ